MHLKNKPEEHYRPSIYPFITIRPEGFGALLFNSYTCEEMELGSAGAFIAGKCDGDHDVDQIVARTIERFGFSKVKGKRYVEDTLARLSSFLAVSSRDINMLTRKVTEPEPIDYRGIRCLSAPKTVYWEVTYACNLKCPHCLTSSGRQGKGELSTEKALNLIEQLVGAKIFQLVITGGEPFLRSDIFELLTRLSSENICIKIDTNGTAISPKMIKKLPDMGLNSLQVSIDGIGEQHDAFRGKKGAFDASCRTIKRLVDNSVKVNMLTTVTPRNVNDLSRIIDLALELGCYELVINPFITAGRGRTRKDLMLSLQEYHKMCGIVLKRSGELKGRLRLYTEPSYMFFFEKMRINKVSDGPMGCSAGNDVLVIGADGSAYPCPFLHDFPLGNITEQSLYDIWHNSPVLGSLRSLHKNDMEGVCKNCHYASIQCTGGCRARAYFEYGSLKAPDPACILPLAEKKKRNNVFKP